MKRGNSQIQKINQKAHDYFLIIHTQEPTLSCKELQQKLQDMGYTVDHTTVCKWLQKA